MGLEAVSTTAIQLKKYLEPWKSPCFWGCDLSHLLHQYELRRIPMRTCGVTVLFPGPPSILLYRVALAHIARRSVYLY